MPPKRRRAAADEAEPEPEGEGEASLTRNLRLSAKSTAVPGKKAQLKSLPAKHTTSYGSPAPILPLQGSGGYGSDLKGATRDIFAAVQRDNKKAKLQQEDGPGESSRTTRRPRSRQPSRAVTPVLEEEEEEEDEEDNRPAPLPTAGSLKSSAAIEVELRRLQARREERERREQREQERLEKEERERAARQEKERADRERADRERAEQQERERVEREERERVEREDKERAKREEKERAGRERAERKERDRLAREARERARQEERERAEQEQQQRVARERQERIEREEREKAERDEQGRIEQEEREQAEEEERLRAAQRQGSQPDPEQAVFPTSRDEFERLLARSEKQRQEEERARKQSAGGAPGPAPYQPPKKRAGEEFLDELFFSPKRPRNYDPTPSAARPMAPRRNPVQPPASAAMSMRSYIEESHVYREADVQTPAPSSVMGDTPSRAPMPGSAASRTASLPPVAQDNRRRGDFLRPGNRPSEAEDTWRIGQPPPPAPSQRVSQPGPSQPGPSPGPEPWHQPSRSVFALADDEDGEERQAGPSGMPRRSTRQASKKLDLAPERRKKPDEKSPADEEPGRDRSSSPSSSGSPPKGKSGPDQRRKNPALRLRQENPRPVRDGAPPGDSPPPDDNSSLGDQFRKAWKDWRQDWRHYLWRALRWLGYFLAFLLALNFVFFLWHRIGRSDWENTRGGRGLEWYGWNHMGRNIGQLVPHELRHPLGFMDDAEYGALRDHIYSQDGRIIKLTDQSNDLRQATQKLEGILPRVVSVKQDKKTSKLVIGQDFWHALKDRIHAEKSILTLERGKDGLNNISDDHWVAVLKRLKAEGVLSKKDVDGIVQGAVSSSWENWLKSNRGTVDKVLGASPGQPLSPDAERKIENLIREKVSGPGLRDIVVTREEFIREIAKSISAHKREAEAELAQVQDSLRDMIEAAKKAASSSGGMSRQEVIALTNEVVQEAISNARLEGVAKGNINNNFERDLSRRVNYFALGNGATIEKSLTSPSYKPPHQKLRFGSEAWVKAKISAPRFVAEEAAALTTWEEAGHCWCAGNKFKDSEHHPADINIRLAQAIVPENLVMEHIDPAATLDPKSMPKDVEIWALVDEYSRGKHARDFMFASWPETPKSHPLLAKGFLKVGEFRYDYDRATNGVMVYRVSEELARLGVATDLVLVRALSNYGADHTCFYRIRLYGTPLEGEEGEGGEGEGWRGEL